MQGLSPGGLGGYSGTPQSAALHPSSPARSTANTADTLVASDIRALVAQKERELVQIAESRLNTANERLRRAAILFLLRTRVPLPTSPGFILTLIFTPPQGAREEAPHEGRRARRRAAAAAGCPPRLQAQPQGAERGRQRASSVPFAGVAPLRPSSDPLLSGPHSCSKTATWRPPGSTRR